MLNEHDWVGPVSALTHFTAGDDNNTLFSSSNRAPLNALSSLSLSLLLQCLLQPPAMTQACLLMGPAVATAGNPETMWCSSVIRVTSCRGPTGSPALKSMVASSGSQTLLHAQVLYNITPSVLRKPVWMRITALLLLCKC